MCRLAWPSNCRAVSKFPPVERDLAYIFDEKVAVHALLERLNRSKAKIVESISVFDVYRGKGIENGKKGLAFRVLLQDTQKTMTDPEVESAIAELIDRLGGQFGGKLRD